MDRYLAEYFRLPEHGINVISDNNLSSEEGYFSFNKNICYGRCSSGDVSPSSLGPLYEACSDTFIENGAVYLPFDLSEVIDNLRYERYVKTASSYKQVLEATLNYAYYLIRPLLPVGVRKHLQRIRLNGWHNIPFPHWPVDGTVDHIFEYLLLLCLRANEVEEIPFIWFWPNEAPSCAIMTHDVETPAGRDFCATLMDIDDKFGVKAAFQIVPEQRYEVPAEYLESITKRGFEVGVQDLNHDGRLYKNRAQFLARAAKINSYGQQWGADGFRAGVLYRRQEWFDALNFSYEMSVPSTARLDPQRGGCCTLMPYFVGKLLEIPVTTMQDYSLFHILKQHSIQIWKRQVELIMEKHGLISFIVHPDYIMEDRERETYESLLGHLAHWRDKKNLWIATPREVNQWWRQRANLRLVKGNDEWHIEGIGSERACIAYATEQDGHLHFSFETARTIHS